MNTRALLPVLCVAGLVALACPVALAQDEPPPPPPVQPETQPPAKPDLDQPVPPEQLLAARVLAQRGMEMMPNQLARQYKLTDEQKAAAAGILKNRMTAMPQAEQDNLIRAMIYGRQLAASKQANPEDWQRLAKEALPALESMFRMFSDAAGDFEKILDDDQRVKYEEEMARFGEGQQAMLTRARLVAEGTIKLGADGEPTGGAEWPEEAKLERRRDSGRVELVEEEVEEVGPDGTVQKIKVTRIRSTLPAEELVAGDEKYWSPFLKGFIAKFSLDEEQTKQARRLLGEALRKAREHRARMKDPLAEARKRITQAEAGTDAQAVEAAHAAYDRLNQPVVGAFREMQRRLDGLLTAGQRESGKTRGELFGELKKN